MFRLRPLLLAALLTACGPVEPPPVASRAEAILGGTPDSADTDVFLLEMTMDGTRTALCSATLVSPRVLLTAAHCVDPVFQGGASTLTAKAMNLPDSSNLRSTDFIDAAEIRRHPQWSASNPTSPYDIALVLLASPPPGVVPRQLSRVAPVQGAVRAAGYGRTSSGTSDSGTRRTVNTTITSVSAGHFNLGSSGIGVCIGDSGGPAFVRGADSIERVAGVHSYGSSQCGAGSDVRVDIHLAFIDGYLDSKDPALCTADGRCQLSGCAAPDPDCVCVRDSLCNPLCPDLTTDPDCPADCVANGVCAAASCPRADPDCLLDGDTCAAPGECLGHQCIADPRGFSFCSTACTDTSECSRSMECREQRCRPPLVTVKRLDPVSGGCAAVPGTSLLAAVVALGLCRRRPV